MTFRFTDTDGDELTVAPTTRYGRPAIRLRNKRGDGKGAAAVDVPVDRVEELVAGIRDQARQAALQHLLNPGMKTPSRPSTTED